MKILVCVDGSEYSKKAVEYASYFAKYYEADVTLIRVIKSEKRREKPVFDEYGQEQRKTKEIIKEAKSIFSNIAPDVNTDSRIVVGPISSEIIRIAEDEEFETIWIGTRGRTGVARMLLGSVADDVINYAHCPVVVVR